MSSDSIETIREHYHNDSLHHAYLIAAEPDSVREQLMPILAEVLDGKPQGHPDFWSHSCNFFGINESHLLRNSQTTEGFGKRRCFLIEADSIGLEAADALLKTLEDAHEGRHFFVVTPKADMLPKTILSRMHRFDIATEDTFVSEARAFVDASKANRMKLIEKYLPKKSTPDQRRALKREFAQFVKAIQRVLHEAGLGDPVSAKSLDSLQMVLDYLGDSGVALRILAEHVVIALDSKPNKPKLST